jgi:hypothetical protein
MPSFFTAAAPSHSLTRFLGVECYGLLTAIDGLLTIIGWEITSNTC